MKYKRNDEEGRTKCACGALSYTGGYCFGCGIYRASKHAKVAAEQDAVDRLNKNFGYRIQNRDE